MALRKRTYTFVPKKDPEEFYVRRAMEAQKEREQELLNDNVGQMRAIEEANDYKEAIFDLIYGEGISRKYEILEFSLAHQIILKKRLLVLSREANWARHATSD